jgi:hypothetical protein
MSASIPSTIKNPPTPARAPAIISKENYNLIHQLSTSIYANSPYSQLCDLMNTKISELKTRFVEQNFIDQLNILLTDLKNWHKNRPTPTKQELITLVSAYTKKKIQDLKTQKISTVPKNIQTLCNNLEIIWEMDNSAEKTTVKNYLEREIKTPELRKELSDLLEKKTDLKAIIPLLNELPI